MTQLAKKPLFLSFLLAIILWFVFDNFVVAAAVGLLAGFLTSMLYSLYVLKQHNEASEPAATTTPGPTQMPPPAMQNTLPEPDQIAKAHLSQVVKHLQQQIQASPGGL